jgi:hypothetical protein
MTALVMEGSIFGDITWYSPLIVNERVAQTFCLHTHGRRIRQTRNQRERRWANLSHSTLFQAVFFIFIYLVCEAIGTAATPGLLCQPRVIVKMIVEKKMGCRLTGETEGLGENLPQRHFCPSQNPT